MGPNIVGKTARIIYRRFYIDIGTPAANGRVNRGPRIYYSFVAKTQYKKNVYICIKSENKKKSAIFRIMGGPHL